MSKINEHKYQVWITEYVLNGADDSAKYDPGFQLLGTYDTIEGAVAAHDSHKEQEPIITKLVTWKTTITDQSEYPDNV